MRELLAVRYTLVSLRTHIAQRQICINTDNQNVVRILCNGSGKVELQEQVVAIFRFSTTIKARLFAQWVPRDLNVTADHLSRIIDDNDWQLEPSLFRHFNAKWAPLTVDRFASHLSAQPPRFNSKWWSPGCEAVDCFTQAWEGEVNWCLPPPALLGDLYAFLANVPCHAVVAFPFWPSAPWWPVWMPENGPCHLATDSEIVSLPFGAFQLVSKPTCLFGPDPPPFQYVFMQVCLMTSCRAHNP